MTRKPKKEFVVRLNVRFDSCTAIVEARDEEEARAKANRMEFVDGIDTSTASLSDLDVDDIEENV